LLSKCDLNADGDCCDDVLQVYDLVARTCPVQRAELVGLVPRSVLDATPAARWPELDLAPDRTIEARVEGAGIDNP